MKKQTFHHGGRLGDCIYALYTMKELGGGDIFISLFHQGNWTDTHIAALLPLLAYQPFIDKAEQVVWPLPYPVDYDLHDAELDYNPAEFPEWDKSAWPGNCHIAKRYAVHFGTLWDPETIWLSAPQTKETDIVVHAPMRRTPNPQVFIEAINLLAQTYTICFFNTEDDALWYEQLNGVTFIQPSDMLEAADYINSAKVFLGSVSSCAVIAEALKKHRLVQVAKDCHNTYHQGETGKEITEWSVQDIVNYIEKMIE